MHFQFACVHDFWVYFDSLGMSQNLTDRRTHWPILLFQKCALHIKKKSISMLEYEKIPTFLFDVPLKWYFNDISWIIQMSLFSILQCTIFKLWKNWNCNTLNKNTKFLLILLMVFGSVIKSCFCENHSFTKIQMYRYLFQSKNNLENCVFDNIFGCKCNSWKQSVS